MNRLKDKVAVITGGTGGIGLATAKLFLEQGAKVVLVDINAAAIEESRAKFNNKNVSFFQADVSKKEDTLKFLNHAIATFGKIDIFFANAGIEGTPTSIAEYPEEVFDNVIAVNLKGVWLGCQYIIPKMEEGGSVIITSSVAGLKGFTGLGAYCATKHAVVGIMRVAANENASRKIRVNTIHPGPVDNDMMRRLESGMAPDNPDAVKDGFTATVPFGRYATSKEIGEYALFLASDDSKYITGCTHRIDGGMLSA
ncbi:NAD(P)-dependent dehydrogenase (short-subunit alcohol dehydrogenase family) [Maribacter spongiicola]|uniref:NAD(P)-dependent dehydrogenase (Short-subunit alcohol dehydrogenase family) n=1 Tax=Maribacter spongiicola TaxID=1206753 RepID=A0A4V3EQP0_9FLAO|nr:SDR family oxidoreductase [Maribacter spongiicola]TDT40488.1 NAD(P)-dependent dehydrogenase (short-subunit alcohol dehydrogenase family) [Maribacter spongiicola]